MPRDLCAQAIFLVFTVPKSCFLLQNQQKTVLKWKTNRLQRLFAAVHNLLSNHAIYYTTQIYYTTGLASFDGLGEGLAAGDGILLPGVDFFIVHTLIRRLPKYW